MDRRHFLSALAGAALAHCAPRSFALTASPSVRRWPTVQKVLDNYVGTRKIAGAVVALSYGGTPLAYPAAGRIALDSPAPFDENSICRIYSMAKPVTGVAAMTLVEDGKLRLDQPVSDVIPEWRVLRVAVDPKNSLESRPATKTMTMRNLLTHTSGLSYWTPESGGDALPSAYRERGITPGNYGVRLRRPGYGPQAKDLVDMIKRLAELPLAAEPGTTWKYSIGFDVMGLVIERISGKSLDAYFRERILEPLQMESTGFHVPASRAARLTTNYDVTPEGLGPTDARESSAWLQPPTLRAGGAGLVSTARDFVRFGAMLLGHGTLDRVQVLRPDTVRLACSNLLPAGVGHQAVNLITGRAVYQAGFGAGMEVTLSAEDRQYGSVGTLNWGGAACTLWVVDPARDGNMVFMTQNMSLPLFGTILSEVRAAVESDLV